MKVDLGVRKEEIDSSDSFNKLGNGFFILKKSEQKESKLLVVFKGCFRSN